MTLPAPPKFSPANSVLRALHRVPANILLVKNVTLHGVFWGSYLDHQPDVLRSSLQQLMSWFGEGKLRVEVSHRCACITTDSIAGRQHDQAAHAWPGVEEGSVYT